MLRTFPKPRKLPRSRDFKRRSYPSCGHSAYRDKRKGRLLHDLGGPRTERPVDIYVTYSQHFCSRCKKYFNADMSDLAPPGSSYTYRVVSTAVRLVAEDGLSYRAVPWHLWRDHRVFVPFATVQNWVETSGEKKVKRVSKGTTWSGHSVISPGRCRLVACAALPGPARSERLSHP